ncbi:MAG: TdeIII family type II restriction endonuclease, partial [Oscillospiraceae bacterium]|nr:TdeIII family type II restriction endonuclease [Oscillospiraceae bacterium]
IYDKPVDLAFFDGTDWNLMELKAGGNLDSSNAPSNVEKILTIYAGLNVENAKLYFATLYNKDGEGNTWKGAVKKHLSYPDMFLIGKNFWNKILPAEVTFETFTEVYKEALTDIDLNKRINDMIEDCLRNI